MLQGSCLAFRGEGAPTGAGEELRDPMLRSTRLFPLGDEECGLKPRFCVGLEGDG